MGFGHWFMDHFWLAAIASLLLAFGAHMVISRLLKVVRIDPN